MSPRWAAVLIFGNCVILCGLAYPKEPMEIGSQPDIEQGRDFYRIHCQECHGAEGRGDGPRAALLAPRPGNLVSAATSTKTDDELLAVLAQGIPRTAMRGWSDQLSDEERKNVLAYVRSLVHFQKPPGHPTSFSLTLIGCRPQAGLGLPYWHPAQAVKVVDEGFYSA